MGKGKSKGSLKSGGNQKAASQQAPRNTVPKVQCQTLEEDEETRCTKPPTHGHPTPERCAVHHAQYRTLTQKYKDASKVVDEILAGAAIPTKDDIQNYNDLHSTLEKARWLKRYLEAIRTERKGREIHLMRFFLKGAADLNLTGGYSRSHSRRWSQNSYEGSG